MVRNDFLRRWVWGVAAWLAAGLMTAGAAETPRSARAALAASDEDGGLAVGAHIGTLGWGPNVTFGLGSRVNLRFTFNQFDHSYEGDLDDVEYEIDLELKSGGAFLDIHPGGGSFRLTLGAMYNGNELSGTATPTDTVSLGDVDFPPQAVGPLYARLNVPGAAGYAGIGFGNPVSKDGRLTVMLDLGVMFYSEPDFDLSAPESPFADQRFFQNALAAEEKKIQDDFGELMRYHPVISLGIALRFY